MEENTPAMTDQMLSTYLQEMERQAIDYRSSDLAHEQEAAIDFYEGKGFGDEELGRSQVVVPVVQEVCDYMAVSVLRTFISGDRVVEFEPKNEEGQQGAADASEGVNHVFMREQDGYKVLHDWLKTGLVEKICATKTACVEDEKRTRRTVVVSEEELALLMGEQPDSIIGVTDNGDGSFQVKIQQVRKTKRYIDLPIPNYELLFSPRTRHEDESEYIAHRCKKTVSDLIEMGFDRDKVEGLPAYGNVSDGRENATWDDEWRSTTNDDIPGLRKVTLLEEYARIDYDGDGVAELLRVFRVGPVILEAEEVEEQPFVVFCPFPRPHRMVGNSLADKVMDIQRNKSVIMRQTFDAMYLSNDPKLWLPHESTTDDTIDDLLTKGPGVIVRGKGSRPEPLVTPFEPGKTIAIMELLSGEQESRTGITRLNQGLDAEAMNKTATGMALQHSQGQQMEEFVARNFAESLARLFMKKLRLMIEHGDPIAMRVDGKFKEANPSEWSDDVGVSIRVGLGSGKKEQRLQNRMQIAELQKEALAMGLAGPKQLYNSGAGIIRDAGLGDPNDFFIDPDGEEYQPPQPQDNGEQAKAMAAIEQAKAKGAADMQIAREKMEGEIMLAREKMSAEMDLARDKMMMEASVAQYRSDNDAMKSYRPGGDLSE